MTATAGRAEAGRGFDVVTFLSDFGLEDVFVGVCHGVLASCAPHAKVIDLTHAVAPGDVAHGATLLARAVPHLAPSVHLAVVDPGVGTNRRGIAVRSLRGDVFVGPDNGLLTSAAETLGGVERVNVLTAAPYRREDVSATFHGRDVFAPAAAAVASGVPMEHLGARVPAKDLVDLPMPAVTVTQDGLVADVALIDRFGNVQLAAPVAVGERAGLVPGVVARLTAGPADESVRYVTTFGDLPEGELGLYEDSDGMLALAVNAGSAARHLGLDLQDQVTLTLA